MYKIIIMTVIGLFFGTFGTTIGGIIGLKLNISSKKALSFILSLASGLMLAVVCFDLIPESLEISDKKTCLIGIIVGLFFMMICDILVDLKYENKDNNYLKTGIIVAIGLALHNIPEGIAIGSGLDLSMKLGLSLALAICFHDIPEGISMAIPMKKGGMRNERIITYVILSGIATGIGALMGAVIGSVSIKIISICLGFAAGAMIYIITGELLPEVNKLYNGRISTMGNMLGFGLGIIKNFFDF